jgi:hypothetical protein
MRRKITLWLATIALVFSALPAAFSQVGVGVGPGGVDVRVGERGRGYRGRGWRGRGRGRGCRTIVEKHRRWDGTVVTRRIERC